jgi:hypothetical protein
VLKGPVIAAFTYPLYVDEPICVETEYGVVIIYIKILIIYNDFENKVRENRKSNEIVIEKVFHFILFSPVRGSAK